MVERFTAGRTFQLRDVKCVSARPQIEAASLNKVINSLRKFSFSRDFSSTVVTLLSSAPEHRGWDNWGLLNRNMKTSASATAASIEQRSTVLPAAQSYFGFLGDNLLGNIIPRIPERIAELPLLLGGRSSSLKSADKALSVEHATGSDTMKAQPIASREEQASKNSVHVYVMLPLDTVNSDGAFRYASSPWFHHALHEMSATGVRGVAVDVWWGAVEKQPKSYNWLGYKQLVELVKGYGLKVQVVLSFHACGGNVGDVAQIPLPPWVLQAGEVDPDLFFADAPRGHHVRPRNREYISFFADTEPRLLGDRSVMQCYEDFMVAFRQQFRDYIGSVIDEVVVGTGPCGELRYPSYLEANGWRFPGVGEFQCYDRRALAQLARAAEKAGHSQWGFKGPHDAGDYNSEPEQTDFFRHNGSWASPYGQFFLSWYSSALLDHGDRLLSAATRAFKPHLAPRTNRCSFEDNSPPHSPTGIAIINPGLAHREHSMTERGQMSGTPSVASASTANLARLDSADLDMVDHSDLSLTSAMDTRRCGIHVASRSSSSALLLGSPAPQTRIPASASMSSFSTDCTLGCTAMEITEECDIAQYIPDEVDDTYYRISNAISCDCSSSTTSSSVSNASEDNIPATPHIALTLKVAGIHWWFRSPAHASELTAGYFNTHRNDGYRPIVALCAKHNAHLTLTCVEMHNAEHPRYAMCGPEELLRQMRTLCYEMGVPLSGENALPIFRTEGVNTDALWRVVEHAKPWHTGGQPGMTSNNIVPLGRRGSDGHRAAGFGTGEGSQLVISTEGTLPALKAFTFLRLGPEVAADGHLHHWKSFMKEMQAIAVK